MRSGYALFGLLVSLVACSGSKSGSGFDPATTNPDGTPKDPSNPDGGGNQVVGGNGDGGKGGTAVCAPSVGNYEVPGNNCDDDNDGKVDNVPVCDTGLALTGAANEFVKAIGICQSATGPADKKWGVVTAAYTQGYNKPAAPADGQHGILPKFGKVVKPREGTMLGVLSSGWAREFDGNMDTSTPFKGGNPMTGAGAAPPGFPKATGSCPLDTTVKDVAAVKLTIKVPDNAQGLAFDFNFHSGEWPEYVCTKFNDAFIAYLSSAALPGGRPDNISFDAMNNPVSVNNGFFDRCTPGAGTACNGGLGAPTKTSVCAGGEAELGGTGFEDKGSYCTFGLGMTTTGGGATGWLTSQAPVKPGEIITLEFMVWDTGDQAYDSSVLIDHLTWQPTPTETKTDRPK